jgi:RNA:NAD 2'-phosphotransferase (TPT1/KptA family)
MNYKKITKNMIDNNEISMAVHGTYYKFLNNIKKNGLNKMKRTHIHFSLGLATDKHVISGMRSNSEVLIYLNMTKCLEDGIELLLSENNVILTTGKNGILETKYFEKIVDSKTGEKI